MPRHRPRHSRVCSPRLEPLEDRRLRAQFGVPWHHPDHLTFSFVPDGTSVNGEASGLFRTLNSQQPTTDWQGEILQAFQTWAAAANLNFALVPDGGQPLGTPGPDQGDPRFGDIRIAAVPMSPEVLAVTVPHDPFLSGTWSGDILLNDAAPSIGQASNLLPVVLHEIGHALGLDDSTDPASVMFPHLGDRTALTPGDIADVQALYGPRVEDPFEGPAWNNKPRTATPMPEPAGYDGTTPLLFYANLSPKSDVDFYTLKVPEGYAGPLTIRLQTAGVSLLAPHLTVFDPAGRVVGDLSSTAPGGDTLQVHLPDAPGGQTYTVEVRGATNGLFALGEYVVAASFDARSTVDPDAINRLARQSYSYLSPEDIQAIFRDPAGALFHVDAHTNDTFATAEDVDAAGVYGSEAPDRVTASLSDPTDVDVYHIEIPVEYLQNGRYRKTPLVMTVTVRATEVNGIMPTVAVFDANENPVPALVLAHGDGTFTIQVTNVSPDSDYFVRVSADPTSGEAVGNYDLDVEYGHTGAVPATFLDGSIDGPGRPQSYTLVVNQTQLFDLLLNAKATYAPGAPGATLHLVLTDSQGRVVAARTTTAGETAGGDPVLLPPGIYRATFVVDAPGAVPSTAMTFRLYGASLTDPIGPALENPTLRPLTVTTSGDGSAAPLPVLGSNDAPYYWLALSLSNRVGANPGEGQAPAATGAGPIPSSAVTIATVAVPTPDGQSATSAVAMGVVPTSAGSGNRPLPARFPTGSDLVAVSLGVPLIVAGLPVQAGPFDPAVPQPGTLGSVSQEVSCLIIREAVVAARTPAPPSSVVVPDGPSPRQASLDRQPAPPDLEERHSESGVGPDLAQAIAILGMAALVYSRLHSGRTGVRIRLPARPVLARLPLMRSGMAGPLTFCYH